ncbi:MAG: cbb3-type cytochrome c oxidase subunit II [Spirochaetales bacterium]|nr:cbb3-type cytochrome c oxidase subunit II [Spirochaetales bacterium]
MDRLYTFARSVLTRPVSAVVFPLLVFLSGFLVQVILPYLAINLSGQGSLLSPPDPAVIQGQEIYVTEGCQYCHTQQLRPVALDHKRFSKLEEFGYFPQPVAAEYDYDSPSVAGSIRIGGDLSRSGLKSKSELEALLAGKASGPAAALHDYGYLFDEEAGDGLFLSWKIKAMIGSGAYLSEAYQISVFEKLKEKSKGDALVAFLLDRGKKQREFAGKYYRD